MPLYKYCSITSYVKDLKQHCETYNKGNLTILKGEILHIISNPLFAELEFSKRADILEEIILNFSSFFTITKVELNNLYTTFYNSDKMTKQ